MSSKKQQIKVVAAILLAALAFTALGIYFTSGRVGFLNKSLTAKAVVVDNYCPNPTGSGEHDYYPVFLFVDSRTGQNITATGSAGKGGAPAYAVGQEVDILYNPEDPENGVTVNSFMDLWFPSILLLTVGIILFLVAILVILGKATKPGYPNQPLFSNTPTVACQECGVKDGTVQLYIRNGKNTLLGMPLPSIARYLCSKCRQKYELEDKGLRICDHCGETIPFEGKCPNCGAG